MKPKNTTEELMTIFFKLKSAENEGRGVEELKKILATEPPKSGIIIPKKL